VTSAEVLVHVAPTAWVPGLLELVRRVTGGQRPTPAPG
jgi:hypothetical protein